MYVIDYLPPEARAIHIMDRSYLDFERLYRMHFSEVFFVHRKKSAKFSLFIGKKQNLWPEILSD